MQFFLTQLQAYNTMFKLLEADYKETKSDDIGPLLGIMCFMNDNSTADQAVWGDWLKAINGKEKLTKWEAFDGMVHFLESYRSFALSDDIENIIQELRSAKNCNDITVPLVKQWNLSLQEALGEPEGTREYFRLMPQTRDALVWLRGFNTVYKFLAIYGEQNKSEDIKGLAQGMLFLPEGGNVDPKASDTWSEAVDDKLMLTKEEVFEGTIRFLETYQEKLCSDESAQLIKTLHSARSCDDMTIPIIQQWNNCFEEALREPVGTKQYVS